MQEVPCQWSHPSVAPAFPWRRPLNPPGDSWLPGGPPDSAPPSPRPAVIGRGGLRRRGRRWPSGWWRRRWSRGRPSENTHTHTHTHGEVWRTNSQTNIRNTVQTRTDRLWRMMCSCDEGDEPVVRVTVLLLPKLSGRPWLVERLSGRPWLDVVWR